MKKYVVFVAGQNCFVEVDGVVRKLGFCTTRYVWARNVTDAEQEALCLVQNELQEKGLLVNAASNPPLLSIDKVWKLGFFASLWTIRWGSGGGATWYPEEGELT